MCALAAVAPVRAQTLFSDTFSDGSTSGWTRWGDIMHDGGGVFRNSCCNADAHYTIDAGAAWTDYTYSIEHLADDDDVSGITFRFQDSSNFYLLTQGFGDNDGWNLRLSKVAGGSPSDLTPPINNFGGAAGQVNSENTWYELKVELSGTSIKVYVDDVLKFDITDSTYATGTAGVWMDNQTAQCRFDNALVVAASTPLAENYRSIGTDSGALYNTGNATINAGSTTMTFAGATLPDNVGVGDEITTGGDTYYIKTKDSTSQVTVHTASASTHTNAAYSIRRAYNTISSWESARDGNLVGEDRCEVGVLYNDGVFTLSANITFNGSTTDSTHHMTLTVAASQRHTGVAGTGVILDRGGGSSGEIDIQDDYVVLEWFEMRNWSGGSTNAIYVVADHTLIQNVILHDFQGASSFAIYLTDGGYDDLTVRNTIIYDGKNGIYTEGSTGAATLQNVTIYGLTLAGIDFEPGNTGISINNCIVVGNQDYDILGYGTITSFSHNMFSTTYGFNPNNFGGNNQSPPGNLDDLFVSIANGSEDLHLEPAGHNALDTGLDLTTDFTDDVDGETRSGSWDIGADEMASTLAVNYRSIGTNSATLYSTGNASITSGSTTMTFAGGASLPGNVGPGDEITIGADTYHIKTRSSATQVTVDSASASTHSTSAYLISRAYNTFSSWESARDGSLVSENRREIGVAYNDGAFSAGCTIDGSTTDDTHYMMITVADGQRHTGVAGSGARVDAGGGSSDIFVLSDPYSQIEWMEILGYTGDSGADGVLISSSGGENATLQYLLLHEYDPACGVRVRQADTLIRNCIFYDGRYAINVEDDGTATVENVTAYDFSSIAVQTKGATNPISVTNTIAVGSSSNDFAFAGPVVAFDYNMYQNITGVSAGANDQAPPGSLDNLFSSITPGSEDLHLESSGHNALDTGVDIAGFTLDIDGEPRSAGSWDIGADEAGGFTTYRSIGTYSGTMYSTGNATVSAGSTTVTFGGGASLPASVGQGDELVIGGETFYIMSRDSATQVSTQEVAVSGHASAGYTIARAYNTFQSWESARDGNLASEKRREVGVTYNDGEFTPSGDIVIDGSTTDDTYYMMLTVAPGQRHTGVAGTGVSINGTNASDQVFEVLDSNFVIEWIEIRNFSGFQVEAFDINDTDAVIENMIIHDFDGASSAIYSEESFALRNSLIYDGSMGIYGNGLDVVYENVTIWDMTDQGILNDNGDTSVTNCIVVGCSPDIELNSGTVSYFGYNMYSTTSGFTPSSYAGNNQSPPGDLDLLFNSITPGSEDLHLENGGHNAMDTGLDLSSTFTTDIDGATRTMPWDMGADEVSGSPLQISSAANQTFTEGDPATTIAAITVTDNGETPEITAADDIRIRIPAGFNMTWDYFDTTATISGPASGKVSPTVSYEDSDMTLVVDVTSDFAASDSVTISDLAFRDFSGASAADNLDLDVDDDATADATDDKTIEIDAAGAPPPTTSALLSWTEVPNVDVVPDPTSEIRFDNYTPDMSSTDRPSASFSHTIGSACTCCTNPVLIVVVMSRCDQGVQTNGVTYGGQLMNQEISEKADPSSEYREWLQVFSLANPPLGTNTLDVTFNNNAGPNAVVALSYFGVDQADPVGAVASDSDSSNSNPVTVDITTTVPDSVVVGGLGQHGGDTYQHDHQGDVTTEFWDDRSGTATSTDSAFAAGEIVTPTVGTYTFEWNGAQDDDWAIGCVELKPAQ